jgi:hypothetical protein
MTRAFLLATTIFIASAAIAAAQLPIDQSRRFESDGAAQIAIARDAAGNNFRLQNVGPERLIVTIKLKSLGGRSRAPTSLVYVLPPFGVMDKIYLEKIGRMESWIDAWSAISDPDIGARQWRINRDAAPFFRSPPAYPYSCMDAARAREQVVVEYDVAPDGTTQNIAATGLTNECLSVAARNAVSDWRYAPKIVDGVATTRRGMETLLTFELSD